MSRGRKYPGDRPKGICKACKTAPAKPAVNGKVQSYCAPCDLLRVKLHYMRKRIKQHGLQAEVESIKAQAQAAREREELLKIILKERAIKS